MKFIITHYYYHKGTNSIRSYEEEVEKKPYGYCRKMDIIDNILCSIATILFIGIFVFCGLSSINLFFIIGAALSLIIFSTVCFVGIFYIEDTPKYNKEKDKLKEELCKKELEKSDREYQQAKKEKEEHEKMVKELCKKVLQDKDEKALMEIIMKKYNTLE